MAAPSAARKVFISYRRDDSSQQAGRIYDRVVQHFGKGRVFFDAHSIPTGAEFPTALADALGQSRAVVVLIGKRWLTATTETGERRLDQAHDFVRQEVEIALSRGLLVIPVLLDGAAMPTEDALPDSIRPLATRQALPVRGDPDFPGDAERLLAHLETVLGPPVWPGRWGRAAALFALAAAVVAALFLAAFWRGGPPANEPAEDKGIQRSRDELVAILEHRLAAFLEAVDGYDRHLARMETDPALADAYRQLPLDGGLGQELLRLKDEAGTSAKKKPTDPLPIIADERKELADLKANVVSASAKRFDALRKGDLVLANEMSVRVSRLRRAYLESNSRAAYRELSQVRDLTERFSDMWKTAGGLLGTVRQATNKRLAGTTALASVLKPLVAGDLDLVPPEPESELPPATTTRSIRRGDLLIRLAEADSGVFPYESVKGRITQRGQVVVVLEFANTGVAEELKCDLDADLTDDLGVRYLRLTPRFKERLERVGGEPDDEIEPVVSILPGRSISVRYTFDEPLPTAASLAVRLPSLPQQGGTVTEFRFAVRSLPLPKQE